MFSGIKYAEGGKQWWEYVLFCIWWFRAGFFEMLISG